MKKALILIGLLAVMPAIFAQQRRVIDLSEADWGITLDTAASWHDDKLYLPPVNIGALPVNEPTAGWDRIFTRPDVSKVKLPATVEEHLWGWNGQTFGVSGNYTGVSWFTLKTVIPAEWQNRRIVLNAGSVRFRAEIFINRRLAGYDLVNSTPFAVDITDFVKFGQPNEIAFRITDPNGNFNWKDSQIYTWGIYDTNPSHGFGGITGKVNLTCTENVFIENIFIKNKPKISEIDVEITLQNQTATVIGSQNLLIEITENASGKKVYSSTKKINKIEQGKNLYEYTVSLPAAKLWDIENPNLYTLTAALAGDKTSERFGFRWFEVRTYGGDRQFFLNGKRIVLRSAISWGYWPDNGITPTDEYARKQILAAKRLGLNMLSFHRAIGQTNVMDAADELGLLIWEEPGGNQYPAGKFNNNDLQSDFYFKYRNEKLARMIVRDRNHPSLILYNLHNERGAFPQVKDYEEMRMAHRLDITRQIIYNSSNGENPEGIANARFKLHLRPNDTTFYNIGWYDRHHAGGPGVYHDKLYRNPNDYLRYSDNKSEIVYWGEEGAIGTPPRLELIKNDIVNNKKLSGWEAADYLGWYDAYARFLKDFKFDRAFPTVDSLTVAMGNVAYYYQGRIIENIRINNTVDGYAVNGWESMKLENHSGVVDNYRNHKGNPDLIAYYNQPLFLSVKTNRKVLTAGNSAIVDIYIVNEKNIKGNFLLKITAVNQKGETTVFSKKVKVSGGRIYGELLAERITVPITGEGYTDIIAELVTGNKLLSPKGSEKVFAVKTDRNMLPKNILVADTAGYLAEYLKNQGIAVEMYRHGTPKSNLLLVGAFEPQQWGSGMSDLIEWVHKGGKLVIVDNPVRWAEFLADKEVLDYRGSKTLGTSWYGGNFFNREHPVFAGLPVNTVFNWEYQCFAAYNRRRIGLRVGSGETLAGCVSDHRKEVYSALSIIPTGRGQIIITTLDIPSCLKGNSAKAETTIDIEGKNEGMATFSNTQNTADAVGIKLLHNLITQ